jgi:hypothetical protein
VAGDAAGGLEQLVAGQFVLVKRRLVTLQPAVKGRIRRDQGLLEFGNRVRQSINRDLAVTVGRLATAST